MTEISAVALDLQRDFPMLWEIAQRYDFAERLGGCKEPLWAEVDAALRELAARRLQQQSLLTDIA